MREILFRGKRKDNGEWVYGYLAAYDLICPGYPNDASNALGEYYGDTPYTGFVEVDEETVGQFTGLLDKNGRRVFEGDILSQTDVHNNHYVRVVKYEMSCGSCCTQVIGFGASGELSLDFIQLNEPFEVIGNIHDNPELL